MNATAMLLEQRSKGHVSLRLERGGIAVLREEGSSKCRIPRGNHEAILINTSGGLAGGDSIKINAEVGDGADLIITTQAAERVYRSLGPAAQVQISLRAGKNATLFWMPHETIVFEGGVMDRTIDVVLDDGANFFAVEAMVIGRPAMGEIVTSASIRDHWSVQYGGKLVHLERLHIGPQWPQSKASFGTARAFASVIYLGDGVDTRLCAIREALGPGDGASAWNGKMVARLLADDAFDLRKRLKNIIVACAGETSLPKTWSF